MSKSAPFEYSVLMSVCESDVPECLNAAIKSMVAQTVPFCDLVLVCNGPLGDGLDAAVARWKVELGSRMSIVPFPGNGGLGTALAAGLPECACDIIACMGADGVSRFDRCEKLLRKMEDEGLDLIGGAIEEFEKVPGDMGLVRMSPLTQEEIVRYVKNCSPFNSMSIVFSRSAVERVGGYRPFPWMEDYWLWARMVAGGCCCANIADVVVDVRIGKGVHVQCSNSARLKSQVRFFSEMQRLGLMTRVEEAASVARRAIAAVPPGDFTKVLVSVVMPAFNSEKYIIDSIVSVMVQTCPDWELIVCDDCSSDDTPHIVKEFTKVDPRIRLLESGANVGAAAARNRGVGVAQGECIALLDSDDVWEPKKLELQLNLMRSSSAPIIYCSYDLIGCDGGDLGRKYFVSPEATFDSMLFENTIGCSTCLIEASLLKTHPFSCDYYHEDYLLWMTLLREGSVARGCPEVLMHYRQVHGSKSSNKAKSAFRRWSIYRNGLGLSWIKSALAFARYSISGLRKYYL